MLTYSLTTLTESIEASFATVTGITRSQDASKPNIGEGLTATIPESDLPLVQCYPRTWVIAGSSNTQQNTFGGGSRRPVQQMPVTLFVDVYIAPTARGLLSEVYSQLITVASACNDMLLNQYGKSSFNDETIRSFIVEGEAVILDYSQVQYHGVRYTITLEVF